MTFDSPRAAAAWLGARVTGVLRTDSREVGPGDGLLAWPGRRVDPRSHVGAALAAGAAACLVEAEGADAFGWVAGGGLGQGADSFSAMPGGAPSPAPGADDRVAGYRGLKRDAGLIADLHFGRPSRELDVVAVTGTNGKTSSTWWLAQALAALGRRAAVVGTLGIGEPAQTVAAVAAGAAADGGDARVAFASTGLTTPDAVTLHAALRRLRDAGVGAVAIEASSIGLVEHRLEGTAIDVAMFTNLTRDHLDHHGDMAAYFAAKRRLFDWPGLRAAVVDVDDEHGARLAGELAARGGLDLWTVSRRRPARLHAAGLRYGRDGGMSFDIEEAPAGHAGRPSVPAVAAVAAQGREPAAASVAARPRDAGDRVAVRTALVGDFNASNLLGVAAALRALGVPLAALPAAFSTLAPVPGRLQRVAHDGPADEPRVEVVVDYAHTPDALDKVLQALRPLATAGGGRLWCVFGCGGDRDATKRPLMGAIAARGADHVVVTSDNPRSEAPAAIVAQILAGVPTAGPGLQGAVTAIEDRRAAIAHAIASARPGDVVLLAGKGHEDYQEIAGARRPFSDVDEARAALQRRRETSEGAGSGAGTALASPSEAECESSSASASASTSAPTSVPTSAPTSALASGSAPAPATASAPVSAAASTCVSASAPASSSTSTSTPGAAR